MGGIWRVIKTGESNIKIIWCVTRSSTTNENFTREHLIDDLVKIRFKYDTKLICEDKNNDKLESTFYFSLSKCDKGNKSTIKTNLKSEELNCSQTDINTPKTWSEWELLGSTKTNLKSENNFLTFIDILISVCEVKQDLFFSPTLYTDTDFTDFSLTAPEGSVPVHKACMAAHSDVFKAMLKGEWKETAEGQVNIKGVTLQTLQQLKDYLYLGTIPEEGLSELCSLLLIARCYLIDNLEKHCIRKLAEIVAPEELFSLIEFACENQIPELPFMLLQETKDSVITEACFLKKTAKLNKDDNNMK